MSDFSYKVLKQDGKARLGEITTARGTISTPIFMPVGTQATVKAMTPEELREVGAQIILGNTYHLYLRPGHELVSRLGGLHKFMNWAGPILTDSGGFQVFSLGDLRKITEEGVRFQSHLDGSYHFLSPERAVEIQAALGADIIMCFDDCPPYPSDRDHVRKSMEMTIRWARRCREAHRSHSQALFGIVQGGMYPDYRLECIERLKELDFPGYALGGLSVGEDNDIMYEIMDACSPYLPVDKPRYIMGIGTPEDLVEGVHHGFDMFDCVMPTRNARNGMLFTSTGSINIRNACHAEDPRPIDDACGCYVCRHYSRAYLRHVFQAKEIIASRLNTYHNLYYYLNLMAEARAAIAAGSFVDFRRDFYARRASRPDRAA